MDFEIAPFEVKRRLDAGEKLHLIDVREPNEFALARIEGGELIPMRQVPGELQAFVEQVGTVSAQKQATWRLVAQAVGAGLLRVESGEVDVLGDVLAGLRAGLENRGGSLSILSAPAAVKSKMDAWGSAGDAQSLMRSIKAQFDPASVLNPGRFIAGI